MRSFILLALIADNPAAAAGLFDLLGHVVGGAVAALHPSNMQEAEIPTGSSLAKKYCTSAAPTAHSIVGVMPVFGGALGTAIGALNMFGFTNDVLCDNAVHYGRLINYHVANLAQDHFNIDLKNGPFGPIVDHFLGVKSNPNFQTVDSIVDQVAPMLSGGSLGFQSANIGAPPPGNAPFDGTQYDPTAGEQMQYAPAPAAPDMGYGAPPAPAPLGGTQYDPMAGEQMQYAPPPAPAPARILHV